MEKREKNRNVNEKGTRRMRVRWGGGAARERRRERERYRGREKDREREKSRRARKVYEKTRGNKTKSTNRAMQRMQQLFIVLCHVVWRMISGVREDRCLSN